MLVILDFTAEASYRSFRDVVIPSLDFFSSKLQWSLQNPTKNTGDLAVAAANFSTKIPANFCQHFQSLSIFWQHAAYYNKGIEEEMLTTSESLVRLYSTVLYRTVPYLYVLRCDTVR